VTPDVSIRFDVFLDMLMDLFSVSTPIGESIVANKVYRSYHVSLSHRDTYTDLVELDTLDFDVVLCQDPSLQPGYGRHLRSIISPQANPHRG